MSRYQPYPSYKDSGVEWLGEVPKDWLPKRLKYHARIKNGQDQKKVLSDNGQYPVYGSGGEFGRANEYLYDKPSVLLGRKGTIDKPLFIIEPFWTVDTMYYTDIAKTTFPKFLYYSCLTIKFDYYQYGSAVPSMTQENLHNIDFATPSYEEQTAIANFLDIQTAKIDTLIAKQQRMIELLGEKRSAMISHAVTKGIDPDVTLKDSGVEWLGEVPEHWEISKIGFLSSKIGSGKTPRGGSEVYADEGIVFIRSQNVYDEGLRLDDVVFISKEIDEEMANTRVKAGDILLNVTGASIGRTTLVPYDFDVANVNQHVCIIRISSIEMRPYIALVMKSATAKTQIDAFQNGAAREGLNFEQIANIQIALPPLLEQIAITGYIDTQTAKIDTLIAKARQTIELMKERRTALISAAVTGKIDVRREA